MARFVVLVLVLLAGCDQRVAGGRVDGPAVFAEACARCHGPGGTPDRSMVAQLGVKDLTAAHVQEAMTDEQIAHQIRAGSDNRRMPSFEGALSDAQIAAVIKHVRALPPAPAPSP